MKKLLFLLSLISCASSIAVEPNANKNLAPNPLFPELKPAKVKEVVLVKEALTGDTLLVVGKGGKTFQTHLSFFISPDADQPLAKESTKYLDGLVRGKSVSLDYSENTLANGTRSAVITDAAGGNINKKMIESGFGWVWPIEKGADDYLKKQVEAVKARRGLWASPMPIMPRSMANQIKQAQSLVN